MLRVCLEDLKPCYTARAHSEKPILLEFEAPFSEAACAHWICSGVEVRRDNMKLERHTKIPFGKAREYNATRRSTNACLVVYLGPLAGAATVVSSKNGRHHWRPWGAAAARFPGFLSAKQGRSGPGTGHHLLYPQEVWWSVEHVQTRLRTIIPSINLHHIIEECLTRLPLTYLSDWAFARGVGPWRLNLWCSITAILTHGCWCQKRSYLCRPRGGPSMYVYIYIYIFIFIFIFICIYIYMWS